MTRVFVFTNHKGGVGKSISATNTALGIAGMLRRAGAPNSRVLLIDTDSQAHATLVTTGTKDYGADNSLYTVLMADRQNAAQTMLNCIVQSTWDADLHVLPHRLGHDQFGIGWNIFEHIHAHTLTGYKSVLFF